MLRQIPTNVITGFLGSGKTTLINQLLANKPENERWAILVNEFGQIGVDQAAFAAEDGVFIKEMAGGCMCCALGPSLQVGLAALLRQSRPDRLLIEPTGLGHPEGIIDTLQSEAFRQALDVRATICLLDPRNLQRPDVLANSTFQDQLSLADVIVVSKCDIAATDLIKLAEASSLNMYPPKQAVVQAHAGHIDPALLDVVRAGTQQHAFTPSGAPELQEILEGTATDKGSTTDNSSNTAFTSTFEGLFTAATAPLAGSKLAPGVEHPHPGKPIRRSGSNGDFSSVGWQFHRDDVFDYTKLEPVLTAITSAIRVKGVFRIGDAWLLFNQVLGEFDYHRLAWRRDSRLEIISQQPLDWDRIEQQVIACIEH